MHEIFFPKQNCSVKYVEAINGDLIAALNSDLIAIKRKARNLKQLLDYDKRTNELALCRVGQFAKLAIKDQSKMYAGRWPIYNHVAKDS